MGSITAMYVIERDIPAYGERKSIREVPSRGKRFPRHQGEYRRLDRTYECRERDAENRGG